MKTATTIQRCLRRATVRGLLLTAISFAVPLAKADQSGDWTYTTDGTNVTISGYTGAGGDVAIPSLISNMPVVVIGDCSFSNCVSLINITIPSTVTNIGNGAFSFCTSLTNVAIPWSVTSIGPYAFYSCTNMTTLRLTSVGAMIASIGEFAFAQCISLTTLKIPYTVTNVGASAFFGCSGVISIAIGCPGTTSIGDMAFSQCTNLNDVYFWHSPPSVGSSVFSGDTHAIIYYKPGATGWETTLGGVTAMPLPFTYIDNPDLTYTITGYTGTNGVVVIPGMIEGFPVSLIGDFAFSGNTNITSLTILAGVTTIDDYSFEFCYSLSNLTIGSSVTRIGAGAFLASNLPRVTIPSGVTHIGHGAFGWSTNMTSITVDALNPVYCSVDGVVFDKAGTTLVQYPGGGGDYVIPSGVTNIAAFAFGGCANLVNVTIPDSVTDIDYEAFNQCIRLTNAIMGHGVLRIVGYAFDGCTSLTRIVIPSSVTNIGIGAFAFCSSMTAIVVDELNSFYSSVDGVLFSKDRTTLLKYPGGIGGSYIIPYGTTNIDFQAFGYNAGLENIIIPVSVETLGEAAFYYCTSLTNICFSGNPPAIGAFVFGQDNILTVCYYPWTSGWTNTFGGRPTAINPAYLSWLTSNSFLTNGTADSIDSDDDGMLNWQEFLAHTDPNTNADCLAITSMGTDTQPGMISWAAKSNVTYRVMESVDLLGGWVNASSGIGVNQQSLQTATMDQVLQYADPTYSGATNAFYRVVVVP